MMIFSQKKLRIEDKWVKSAVVRLSLADGACWNIVPENPDAKEFVEQLADIMQLSSPDGNGRYILVRVQDGRELGAVADGLEETLPSLLVDVVADYPWDEECRYLKPPISCILYQEDGKIPEPIQLMQFSYVFVMDAITRGGMLLHGALIERDGMGVILAGQGGVGKTTACSRLPESWRTLSDDSTLIVRDPSGDYWAHPWPTWSRFLVDEDGGSWDVGSGVVVKAVCFLSQSSESKLIPLGEGEMVCLGMEAIEQANRGLTRTLDEESGRKLGNIHFRNMCQMAKAVPGYRLSLEPVGPFWELFNDF